MTTNRLAAHFDVSEFAVRAHLRQIMGKWNISHRVDIPLRVLRKANLVADPGSAAGRNPILTKADADCVALLANGIIDDKTLAEKLGRSEDTIGHRVQGIVRKYGFRMRNELIVYLEREKRIRERQLRTEARLKAAAERPPAPATPTPGQFPGL